MNYTYIDGDNIGLRIENSFLENNEENLKDINVKVKSIVIKITKYLISKEQEIIFSGADGIICKGKNLNLKSTLNFVRKNSSTLTFSIGSGYSLKDSYIALRYAKSLNKNIAALLKDGVFSTIDE